MKALQLVFYFGVFMTFIVRVDYIFQSSNAIDETFHLKQAFHIKKLGRRSLPPLILTWTEFFGKPWVFCSSLLAEARAVLFHIRDLRRGKQFWPKIRHPKQLFVFVLHESPAYTLDSLDFVDKDFFNITMTYRQDSDIHIPYGAMKKIDKLTRPEQIWNWSEVIRIAGSKTESTLLLVSNCHTISKRELYVEQLQRYMNITQYGSCNNRACNWQCERNEIARHHFYLAFENSICKDYVTEKLYKNMAKLMIPVVLKRSIYNGILPSGSFIAANDFASPQELAKYLQYLLGNKMAYLSYLEWTKHYKKSFKVSNYCELCKYLHRGIDTPRIIPDIRKWWYQGCIPDYALKLLNKTKDK